MTSQVMNLLDHGGRVWIVIFIELHGVPAIFPPPLPVLDDGSDGNPLLMEPPGRGEQLFLGGETLKFDGDATWGQLKTLYNGAFTIGGVKVPTIIFWFLGFALVFFIFLHLTTGGRKLFAIGENRTAALYSGIRVDRFELLMFVICGMMAAVSSLFYVGSASATVRADAMTGYEMYAIASVVLAGVSMAGGKGNMLGVIFGALSYTTINFIIVSIPGLSVDIQDTFQGLVLIIVILIQTAGPAIKESFQRSRKRRLASAKAE